MTSILTALGGGSGIDTAKLVADLTDATRQPRQSVIDRRASLNTARIGAVAQLSSSLATLASGSATRARTLSEADIASFVGDFVDAVNALRTQLADFSRAAVPGFASGPLSGDSGARTLSRTLSALAGSDIAGRRLSELGITTARDGSLVLDRAKLDAAILADLPGVKALLGVGSASATGLVAALAGLRDTMTGNGGPLTLSKGGYDRSSKSLLREQEKLNADVQRLGDRLTKTYSAMDRQVAVIKASQAYLTQQVAIWTAAK